MCIRDRPVAATPSDELYEESEGLNDRASEVDIVPVNDRCV